MADIETISRREHVPVNQLCRAVMMPRASYYRKQAGNAIRPAHDRKPNNALPGSTRQQILDLLHSDRFVDCTPYQIYYTLLDEGQYYASIRTFYRLLEELGENEERRNLRNHRDAVKPELMASMPNQVWTWDITKLLSTQRLVYYHLYVILDMFSRYVVGWLIADRECKFIARDLIQKTTLKHGIQPDQLTIHSDNGPSMTSHTVSELLEHLGVLKTHNRPYTSNDNPFSESQFKTLKYCPQFPNKFASIEIAEKFCQDFFRWYNQEHYHSGILWLTPQTVHYGLADICLQNRFNVLNSAFRENPTRFNNRKPQLKKLEPVYINPPKNILGENALQEHSIMA